MHGRVAQSSPHRLSAQQTVINTIRNKNHLKYFYYYHYITFFMFFTQYSSISLSIDNATAVNSYMFKNGDIQPRCFVRCRSISNGESSMHDQAEF